MANSGIMIDTIPDEKSLVAKHQTNEFYELLLPCNPTLHYQPFNAESTLCKEMLRFNLIPPLNHLKNGNVLDPFIYHYKTRPELVLNDQSMLRMVWYNVMFTCLKSNIWPVNYDGPIENIQENDLHESILNILPTEARNLLKYFSSKSSFDQVSGGGAISFLLFRHIRLHKIPRESILYITREVESIDFETVEGNTKILELLSQHEESLQENTSRRMKNEIEAKRLNDQCTYLTILHPNIPELKILYESKLEECLKSEIVKCEQTIQSLSNQALMSIEQERRKIEDEYEEKKKVILEKMDQKKQEEMNAMKKAQELNIAVMTEKQITQMTRLKKQLEVIVSKGKSSLDI